ncbi:methyltransferase domain-containing protein [bacterium]|nr:methyltransferase domain-containing protein [bacterium]
MSSDTNLNRLNEYYTDLGALFQSVSENSGYYNLGWLPEGSLRSFRDGQRELVRNVANGLRLNPGAQVLDIGAGRGAPARYIADRFQVRVVALERLADQAEHGHHATDTQRVDWIRGDAAALPFADDSFDGAVSIESAFHYPDRRAFLHETARVLRHGGRLALADIVIRQRYKRHIYHNAYRRALASPGLWTLQTYRDEFRIAGFRPQFACDLTPGVVQSLHNAAPDILRLAPALRKQGYSALYLSTVWLGFLLLPQIRRRLPATYHLMVAEKR